MAGRFEGSAVLITGGGSGIGAALAHQFAAEGARVAVTGRREDKLAIVAERIREKGGEALAIACDVTDRASIDAAVAKTVEAFGGLDVCVANAGFGIAGSFDKCTTDDYRRQFNTNVFGVIDTAYAALPHLAERNGRFAVVSSAAGRLGLPGTSAYNASKFAVCGWAESVAPEWVAKGVSLTLLNPGLVESEIRYKDNDEVVRADFKDPAPKWLTMSAETAARKMINAIHRRRFEVIITNHAKLMVLLARLCPRSVHFLLRKFGTPRPKKA